MSTVEEQIGAPPQAIPRPGLLGRSISWLVHWLSSVRLGVILLVLLGLACVVGMLIMQQNVDGFENYYASLTPAQRLVYGKLDLFNVYHAWYFNALLGVLSLNIILASVDRFPKTWIYVSRPQVTVPLRWLLSQQASVETDSTEEMPQLQKKVESLVKKHGWKNLQVMEKNGRTFLLAQSGTWNRFGAYAVHVALLTIFLGGFLTSELGTTGNMPLAPGESSDLIEESVVDLDKVSRVTKQLPFEVTFTDIEQKLLKREGSLSAGNTIDWITRFTISDETGQHDAIAQMNRPFDYRGYRFFQASYIPVGRARSITLTVSGKDSTGSTRLTLGRGETTTMPDGTRLRFAEFRGNFRIGPEDPNEDTSDYLNPAAVLQITPPGGSVETAYAFGPQMAEIPAAKKAVAGYTFRLEDFEKVSDRHILSVQRDPGATVVYIGFGMLSITLCAVFLFSHQRVWVVFEKGPAEMTKIVAGGNSNRNPNPFTEKFGAFAAELRDLSGSQEEE